MAKDAPGMRGYRSRNSRIEFVESTDEKVSN